MNLKYILNLLLVFVPLVLSSECDTIDKSLLESVKKCSINEKGKIIGLTISNKNLTEEQVNNLLTYDLTELSYTIEFEPGSFGIPEHPGYSEVPPAINNLKNLESLKIFYDCYLHPCAGNCMSRGIITIGKNILKDLKKLKILDIEGIKVSQENINEISSLDNLESLSFISSYLNESLNFKSLSKLNNLTKLEIRHIQGPYTDINGDTYQKVIPKNLVISNKGIKDLTMFIGAININKNDLPNLEKLMIGFEYDFDTTIVEQFDKLTDLGFAYISQGMNYKPFTDIKGDLSKLKKLNSLYLDCVDNTAEVLNKVIDLPHLEKLTLISNNRTGLSEVLKNFKNITVLEMENQYEKEMDSAIKTFTKLRSLSISYSHKSFEIIPEYIYSFSNLEYLMLPGNFIKIVDEKLANLKNLKHLDLSSNQLTSFPGQIMNLKKLEYLNLRENYISDDSPEFLNKFENLKYLYIQDNKNIRGKVIVNKNLIECEYSESYDLCISKNVKEIKCLNPKIKFEVCIDDDIEESTNGLCGKENGKCPYGQCCSKDGKCGTTDDYCLISNDCQMKFGKCINECEKYIEFLSKNNIQEVYCESNKEGKAINVEFNKNYVNVDTNTQLVINYLLNLSNLEKLTLKYLDYENDSLEPLKKIKSLTDLKLITYYYEGGEKSKLYEIPEVVLSLTNLKRLEIYNNNIKSIPDGISNLKNLEYLGLSINKITNVSPKISELENLKEIDLSYCNIKEFPVEFGNLKNLEILSLSSCEEITNYSDFIGSLKNLKSLDLSDNYIYNRLSNIPKEIGNLSQLENLNLNYNMVKEIPKEYRNLKNLKELKLYYNQLTKFPEEIAEMEKLEKLNIANNLIDDEIPKSYNNLSNLTEINVSNNKNIRGETLTNKNLVKCNYDEFSYYSKDYSLCRHGNETCLTEIAINNYKLCENSSIQTTTTITTAKQSTTKSTTTTTPKQSTTKSTTTTTPKQSTTKSTTTTTPKQSTTKSTTTTTPKQSTTKSTTTTTPKQSTTKSTTTTTPKQSTTKSTTTTTPKQSTTKKTTTTKTKKSTTKSNTTTTPKQSTTKSTTTTTPKQSTTKSTTTTTPKQSTTKSTTTTTPKQSTTKKTTTTKTKKSTTKSNTTTTPKQSTTKSTTTTTPKQSTTKSNTTATPKQSTTKKTTTTKTKKSATTSKQSITKKTTTTKTKKTTTKKTITTKTKLSTTKRTKRTITITSKKTITITSKKTTTPKKTTKKTTKKTKKTSKKSKKHHTKKHTKNHTKIHTKKHIKKHIKEDNHEKF